MRLMKDTNYYVDKNRNQYSLISITWSYKTTTVFTYLNFCIKPSIVILFTSRVRFVVRPQT